MRKFNGMTIKDISYRAGVYKTCYRQKRLSHKLQILCESLPGWKWEKKVKRAADWVPIAEKLAKQNGGLLPCFSDLVKHKVGALQLMLYKYPNLFSHIKQKRAVRSAADWVPIAEKLAKQNGGLLANRKRLVDSGYEGLVEALRNHPHYFNHIPQIRLRPATRDTLILMNHAKKRWVPIAEKLAKQNGGLLPSISNRKDGLYSAVKKYPQLFSHIKKKQYVRTPAEWLVIAQKLCSKNGGVLPSVTVLRNGYTGLVRSMQIYKRVFSVIKRGRRR